MSEAPSVADVLAPSGPPTASFKEGNGIAVGHYYNGRVVKEEVSQQTSMGEDPKPLYWDEAKTRPRLQIVLTIQNDVYKTEENPEGFLRVFLKGGALLAAQETSKALGINSFLHGIFQIQWIGTKPAKTQGFNDAKVYKVDFQPGVAPAQAELLGGGVNPATGEVSGQQQWAAVAPAPLGAPAPPLPTPQPVAAQLPVPQPVAAPQPLPVPQPVAAPVSAPAPVGAANVVGILGGVEITPLDPTTAEQVKQLHSAGLRTAGEIVAAFAQYNRVVTETQVNAIIDEIPV